jgi:hypothetical protein
MCEQDPMSAPDKAAIGLINLNASIIPGFVKLMERLNIARKSPHRGRPIKKLTVAITIAPEKV